MAMYRLNEAALRIEVERSKMHLAPFFSYFGVFFSGAITCLNVSTPPGLKTYKQNRESNKGLKGLRNFFILRKTP